MIITSSLSKIPLIARFCPLKTTLPKPTFTPMEFADLQGRISKEPGYVLNEKDRVLVQQAMRDYKAGQNCAEMTTKAFTDLLIAFLNDSPSSIKDIQHFLSSLDQNQLLSLSGLDEQQMKAKINTQETMKDVALKSVLHLKGKALLKEFAPQAIELFHHIMEMLIAFTSLNEISLSRVENSYDAQYRFQMYSTIIGYPALIFGALYAATDSIAISLPATFAAVVGTLAAIIIYTRYFRPCPKEAPPMNNLTMQALKQNQAPAFVRHELLNQIKRRFQSGKSALLIGDPGCGKSSLIRAFAQEIADGNIEFLKGAQVFQANAATFGNLTDGGSFNAMETRFKDHTKQVVFFLDEIHTVFKSPSPLQTNQADILKTFCDRFPFVIIATTKNEYEKYVNTAENAAFLRRFGSDPIVIPALSPTEIESILKKELYHLAPGLLWDADVISYIANSSKLFNRNTAQIDAAFSLLKSVVVRATVLSLPVLENELNLLKMDIDCLQIALLNHYNESDAQKLQDLQEKLKNKNDDYQARTKQLALLHKTEAQFIKVKQQAYILASQAKKNSRIEHKWLQNNVFSKILQAHIETQRVKVGLPGRIDRALVDKTISENRVPHPLKKKRNRRKKS